MGSLFFPEQISQVYGDRCVRIHLSAAAAAAAMAPPLEGSSDGDDDGAGPAAAAAAKAAAAATKEILTALYRPSAVVLVDGLLQPAEAKAVREGLALGFRSQLHLLDSRDLRKSQTLRLTSVALALETKLFVLR